jgi:DNA-binding NtrC family response regulator
MARILIVEDEPNMRRLLGEILRDNTHEVIEAGGLAEARRVFASEEIDIVITDQKLTDGEGLDVLSVVRDTDAAVPVIFLTAFATVELAVDAMRAGAFDFLTKPFLPEQVLSVVRRAGERTQLFRENERLRGQVRRLSGPGELVGRSAVMVELRERIARVAPANATVLIVGETGTGKELVARSIHASSQRAERAFLPVNCAGFSESLLESELFGHERGAFTGADRQRYGVFEAAHGGTLFLDEAGEMSLALQAKLLRVLVTGELVRVGSTVHRRVDVRVVAATHRDLRQRIADGLFREDLYYRIAVVPIQVPALRERKEDIPLLVEHLLSLIARELKIGPVSISPLDLRRLVDYDFPGNIRELRNLLERATILARGEHLQLEGLPIPAATPSPSPQPERSVEDWLASAPGEGRVALRELVAGLERTMIARAMAASDGVVAEAARNLGISRSDLAYKLRRLGLIRLASR